MVQAQLALKARMDAFSESANCMKTERVYALPWFTFHSDRYIGDARAVNDVQIRDK